MIRFIGFVFLAAMTALGTQTSTPVVPSDQAPLVTFNKDVLPILQKNCQTCHRPDAVAPMSFLSYESTRPYARAIKATVVSKTMPPWFADPHYGDFRNARRLTSEEIQTLVNWADSGAREGAAEDMPGPAKFADDWHIQPDVVVSMPSPYRVKAKGEGEIKEFLVPNPFKTDTWVSAIEIRPGDPSVVHHVILQVPEEIGATGFSWGLSRVPRPPLAVLREGNRTGNGRSYPGGSDDITGVGTFTTMEAVYAPGSQPLDFRYHHSAKLIRAGRQLRIEVHYTPNGKETLDQTQIAFTLAETPVQRRFVMMAPASLVDPRKPIPAGESNWESTGELTFNQDVELVWFMPHMHLRGKDMTFRMEFPNGRSETLLSAKFNFHWQLGYEVEEPIKVPRGTKMIVSAHYDNSRNNRTNPDPTKDISWGELTSQEMMLPWFGVVVKEDADPAMIASYTPGGFDGRAPAARPFTVPKMIQTPVFNPSLKKPGIIKP